MLIGRAQNLDRPQRGNERTTRSVTTPMRALQHLAVLPIPLSWMMDKAEALGVQFAASAVA
jgi:hypothetical protein